MSRRSIIGQTVALVGCPAHYRDEEEGPGGIPVILDGLFVVEEFCPTDRSAYIHEPMYGVSETAEGPMYYVIADEFERQVWPKAYARGLVLEREMAFHEEEQS